MSEFEKNFRETIDLGVDSSVSGGRAGRNLQRLSPGDKLSDSYVLRVRLGRGGMGEIWKAEELSNGKFLRHVVIKVVAPDIQNAELELKRIEEMFQKIHSLQHQHICPMYAMKEDPVYGYFIVMKFIDGVTLQGYHDNYLKEHGNFPLSELARLLAPIADALDYSHSKKILHRDVKPQNIMVSHDPSDGVQLIDFGLVADLHTSMTRSTMTQISTSGTLPYMSPEQWSGEYQDAQTDQFSLAVVAYELLSGKLPFVASDVQVLGFQILNKTPPPIEWLPDYTNAALQRGLAKNRKERFDTCADFVHALEHAEPKKSQVAAIARDKYLIAALAVLPVLLLLLFVLPGLFQDESTEEVASRVEPPAPVVTETGHTQPPAVPEPAEPVVETPSQPTDNTENTAAPETPETAVVPPVVEDDVPQATSQAPAAEPQTPVVEETPQPVVPAPPVTVARTPEELLAEAQRLAEEKKWQDAISFYTQYLATENPAPEAYRLRAVAYENAQTFLHAYDDFMKYVRLETDDAAAIEALLDCANMCEEFRDYGRAVSVCDMLAQRMERTGDPRLAEVLRMETIYLVSAACETVTREKYQVASESLKVMLKDAPHDSELLAEQARLLFTTRWEEKACDVAMTQLNGIMQRDPQCVKALLYLGMMKRDVYNSKVEAIQDFIAAKEMISQDMPDEQAEHLKEWCHFQMALTWVGLGNKEYALRDFEVAAELTPNDRFIYYERGRYYMTLGMLTEAAADFRMAVKLAPDFHVAECQLANYYLRKAAASTNEKTRRADFQTAGSILTGLIGKDKDTKNHIVYYEYLMEIYQAFNNRAEVERCKKQVQELKAQYGG